MQYEREKKKKKERESKVKEIEGLRLLDLH